ncbi:MAG: ABC transporter ATP-binding protein [Kofleriaceae bacterium]
MTTALVAHGLAKRYGARIAVAEASFEVAAGEIVGLLGPNGAGKTTTISMIAGVVTADAGHVEIAGHDLARAPGAARAALGLVPQELALYEELSARQNLRYFGRLYGLRGADLDARCAWALEAAGLADRAREPVQRFSGGMKRRLNLVIGLLHRPTVVILDEPTVGVDPQSRAHLLATVAALRDDGMAVVYTSHYMEEVAALCGRIAIMDEGTIVARGTVDELVAAHASGAVEIELSDATAAAACAAALRELAEVTVDGAGLRVRPRGALAPVVAAVEATVAATPGATLRALSTHGGDLEAVFLALTGHRLRDGAA